MNHLKDRKPSRPDIQEILSRMKSRFINEGNSDNEDYVKEENMVTTSNVESVVKEEPIEKSPDDEIAELMLKLNGQVDEELVASIRSRKKMYENPEVDSTSSITNHSDETEEEKPRIILTLRPNENKPDSYVSSSNLTDYSANSLKRKKIVNDVDTVVQPLKRSSRRSNDSNQSVLKSAIARKERTFNIDVNSKQKLPKKIKKEPEEVSTVLSNVPNNTSSINEGENRIDKDIKIKEERSEEGITDQKKKKKKFFRGGRYNIFKKKSLQKSVKKVIRKQLNAETGNFEVDSSETNSERLSVSVCSEVGTFISSDRNDHDDMDNCSSIIDVEDNNMNDSDIDLQDKEINLCLCNDPIEVIVIDEGKITCKAVDCIDGKLFTCMGLAYHLDTYGNMPMLRANVALPFLTYCVHHLKRFFLHQSCPRCGRFCSEGIFMMCKNKHFSHIGCHQKEKGCSHCGIADVYELELKRHVLHDTNIMLNENLPEITVEIGDIKLTNINCPPDMDAVELTRYLKELKDEIIDPNRTMYSVLGLYQACESNDIKKTLAILGSECNLTYRFPDKHNRTALHAASSKGNSMIVYLLLQAGVDPNLVDDKMKSPIRLAAKYGHSNVVQYLMNFNGSPEIKDIQGMTALHLAAKNGKCGSCKVILNKRQSMVNWKDNGGWTPLVWACENGHSDVVKYFITLKPNTRIPDEENNVALHWAAISGCLDVVKHVVTYDSEVNMFNDAGDTALHIAARKNDHDIVSFLLEKGAMAWHKNKGKKRPIDCCLPNTKCYQLLKNVLPEQRKAVTVIQPLVYVDMEIKTELENPQTPIFVKTTPILISEDITHGCEDVPIRCVNDIDDEVPVEFTYIKENCYDVGNYVDSAMSHIASCNCEGACNTSDCKCVQANGECLYDENGRLNSDFDYFNPSVIIYECNWRCRCHKQRCGNRVIQKGIKVELELYRHKDMGWAIRTRQAIPRGTFVCEYVGEIVTDQKANELKEDSYLFNLENPGATELYCIDAYNYSNVSRFINHSCDPNLMSVRSFINHHDKRFPRIAFFAVQDIQEYEQLSYDYGTAFWKIKGGLFTCKCDKANCSFSDETIKSLHIDSDNEEAELDDNNEQNKTDKITLSNNELLNQGMIEKNEIDSHSQQGKTKISKNNNLLERKNKNKKQTSSKVLSVTAIDLKKNNRKSLSVPKTRLLSKNKSKMSVVKNNNLDNNVSKQLLKVPSHHSKIHGTKVSQNKLQPVMLKKNLITKMLNGKSSPVINKTVMITRKKSFIESKVKDKISNDNRNSLKSGKLTNNKSNTSYVLRPKLINKLLETDETISCIRVYPNQVLPDAPGNKKTISNSKDSNSSSINIIKTVPIDKESNTKLVNEKQKSVKCSEMLCTSTKECDKVKMAESLDIKNSYNKECFHNTNQNNWPSIGSFSNGG